MKLKDIEMKNFSVALIRYSILLKPDVYLISPSTDRCEVMDITEIE